MPDGDSASKRESGSIIRGACILKIKEKDKTAVGSQAQCVLKMRMPANEPEDRSSAESEELLDSEPQLSEPEAVAEEETDLYFLPYFNSAMFATILEDTISSLRVLAECNSHMRIWKTEEDLPQLQSRKHDVQLPPVTDELAGIDPRNLSRDTYKLSKFEDDRTCINDVVVATYKDLSLSQGFHHLMQHVDIADQRERYILMLTEDEAKNRIQLRESRRQFRQQRVYFKKTVYDVAMKIEDLVLQIEDVNDMTTIRSNMVRRWQAARTEQLEESVRQREGASLHSITRHKLKYEHEQRAHTEIELIVNILIDEAVQEVENWMEKYETDMEQIDLKIQIRKSEYQDMLGKRHHIELMIEHHAKEMETWNKFKNDREEERKYKQKMHRSATTVQAWWRGMLVRHQLGPFRPRRGKGKGARRLKTTTTT